MYLFFLVRYIISNNSYSSARIRGVKCHLGLDIKWSSGGALSKRPVSYSEAKLNMK